MNARTFRRQRKPAMIPKRRLALPVLLAVLGPPLFPKVTLREAVDRALRTSPALSSQRLNEDAAAARKAQAEARRTFDLNLGGMLSYGSDSPHVRVGDVPLLAGQLPADVSPDLFLISTPRIMYDARLALSLPVYAGGGIRRMIEAEDAGARAEQDLTRAQEARLAVDVRTSYFTVRVLEAKRESLALLRESLDRRFDKLRKALEADLVRRTDVLETQLQLEEVGLSALDLDQALAEERLRFASLCGLDSGDVEDPGPGEAPGFEEALTRLRTDHPLLRYLDGKAAQVEILRRAAAGQDLPQVAAFAQLHFGRPGISLFNPAPQLYILGGLSVDFSLLNARKSATQAALAEIEGRRIERHKAETLQGAERELRRLYALKASVEAKSAVVERLAGLAEDDLKLKTRLYDESQIPNLDCLAAMAQLEKYRSMRHDLRYQRRAVVDGINALIGAGTEAP
jgi:outer membrane protein TolC